MDLRKEVADAHGVAVAQTALLAALIGVLRAQGILDRDLINVMLDAAVTQVEVAPGIEPAMADRARQIIEIISAELQGDPRPGPV